ncbi:MAG: DNA recombination protein RmuC [Planctomycetota bacterium]|jgi:DNA recombination protein RmuC|nr:DNA recombination protein RmuC [Planctomycetota bacterium]HBO51455.1 DNA recombination protein RmuC [Planctomycetota bacterium]
MDLISLLYLLLGFAGGCIVTALLYRQKMKSIEALEEARKGDQEGMEKTFESLSYAALKESTSEFLKLAKETLSNQTEAGEAKLDEKKKLIDARLETMGKNLDNLLKETVKLKTGLTSSQAETNRLRETTEDLRNVLSSSQARGQWGEKMVEDILNLVGLVEHINFVKQKQVESGEKPDFTFLLPNKKKVNLDAKFPLAHYERFVAADDEAVQETEKKQFLADVKGHIKTVADRDYINPAENTVDYVLVFIPNESIYAFIHQSDPAILDFALEKRIILCSPITLYAVVSLIHQAVSNFAMEERAGEIMKLLADFQKQWDLFKGVLETMGKRIESAQMEYEKLTTTRTRQLEKPLNKIEEIRSRQESGPEFITEDSTEA